MKIAAVQHDIAWRDPAANFARLAPEVARAAAAGADLVLLTETYATGFATEAPLDAAEPAGGPAARFLAEQAAAHGVWVGGSAFTVPEGASRPVNRFTLAGPDGTVHHYDKRHRFGYGGEADAFAGGRDLVTVTVAGARCSLFVCYDLRFADDFWALAPSTDVYLVPANWPAVRRHHWRSLLVARAIENQAYVVGANRVGDSGGIPCAGDTMVVDPLGEIVASAAGQETIVLADVSPDRVADVRREFPFLADR